MGARVAFDDLHELAMALAGTADQTSRSGPSDIVLGQIVTPVLVDREKARFALVAVTPEVPIEVAIDGNLIHLDQSLMGTRLMRMVGSHRPRLALAESDPGRATGIHRVLRPVAARFGRPYP